MIKRDQKTIRRTNVVFADMVNYSSLCARDASKTHHMWMDFVDVCLLPHAENCSAEVIRLMGDGCLLNFESPEKALEWCVSVRTEIIEKRQSRIPQWPSLSMRFGINNCDVIDDRGDIYGDGVNVTKRLQEKAQSDGILLTQSFCQELSQSTEQEFRYLGQLQYKNLEALVATYEVIFSDLPTIPRINQTALPSIAILPFQNFANDEKLNYFCEGVIDDMIQSLACLREVQVISRGSTLAFSNQFVDPREISRILSARYVLQGKVTQAGDVIRLSTTFDDAATGDTIFGETCEFPHSQLFQFQDNIVRQIVSRVSPNVRASELERALRKPPENFTAYQCTLQAFDLMKTLNKPQFEQARELLEQAIALDPKFELPVSTLVRWYCINIGQGWDHDRDAQISRAKELAALALNIDRQSPLALAAFGHVKSYLERDLTTALVYFDRARQLGPSHAMTWILSSATLCYLGKGEEAIVHAKRAIELSPNDHDLFQFYDFLTLAHYCCGEFEHALVWARLSNSENPNYTSNLRQLVACYMALGRNDEAGIFVDRLLRLDPTFDLNSYKKNCPFQDELMRTNFFRHLENAGLPNEASSKQ